jgi:hypothetical protein
MLYLVWYDADARRTVGEKIQDASAAYVRRFSAAPNLVLVNIADVTELAALEVRAERTVQPHHFWVGRSDEQIPEQGAPADG